MKIYRRCTREPYSFLTVDTTLPASNPLRFLKKVFLTYKNAVTDQLKVIDDKIKANQTQYDLDRLAAKISALPSGELRKNEYLIVEDLGYKPRVLEQAKFDYSPLDTVFTKRLDKDDQEEVLFERLRNIKGKSKELLEEIKNRKTKESDEKDSQITKAKNSVFYDSNNDFGKYRLAKFLKILPIEFEALIMFYKMLISLKGLEPKTEENINHKSVVLNEAFNDYDKTVKEYKKVYEREPRDGKSDVLKLKYDSKYLKDQDYQPVKLGTESFSVEDRLDIEKPMQLDKTNKPLLFEINKSEFAKLTRDIDNNQNNKDFKIIVNKKPYHLKNAKKNWIEVTTRIIKKV